MLPLAAGGGMTSLVGFSVSTMPSVVSVAVNVSVSTVRSVTVKTTAPLSLVVIPLDGVIVA